MLKALLFDVFGTTVDWRTSLIHEGELLAQAHNLSIDWGEFADAWRAGYQPAMDVVRRGERPWVPLDMLHREILDSLLIRYGIDHIPEEDIARFNRAWHRLNPWPDVIGGLHRLKSHFICAPLSNGSVALLVNMTKYSGLPWDCVLSAELAGQYKPQPQVYLTAVKLLAVKPDEVMMVAAHHLDLVAAAALGLRTAYVHRPAESPTATETFDSAFDINARDFHDLADQLIGLQES